MRRRLGLGAAIVVAAVVVLASPAAAHTEWEPATAAPGSIVDLTLVLADEEPGSGTNRVDLQFPEAITVTDLPAVPGWTATLVGGQVGGPATGVSWVGGPAPDDLRLPISLGPLPNEARRLQFKAVQTYDNGAVHSWIEDWPAGAPEPDMPGPVLDLVAGGPGSIPATTAPTTTTTPPTTTSLATTTTDADETATAASDGDDDGGGLTPYVLGAVVIVGAAGAAFAMLRAKKPPAPEPEPEPPPDPQ